MSREIKFRAWFSLQKKMVEHGDLVLSYDNDGFTFAFDGGAEDENRNIPGTMNFELMQYTGLKDKNGVEIYEGDIVNAWGGEYSQGFYEYDETVVVKNFIYDTFCLGEFENLHVIGNIYEHPHLLKTNTVSQQAVSPDAE